MVGCNAAPKSEGNAGRATGAVKQNRLCVECASSLSTNRSTAPYQRPHSSSAPGVTQRWLDLHGEIAVENVPTIHGSLSYRLQSDDDKIVFDLLHTTATPPKGYIYYQLYDSPSAPIKVDGKPYKYAIRDQTIVLPRGAKRIEIQW